MKRLVEANLSMESPPITSRYVVMELEHDWWLMTWYLFSYRARMRALCRVRMCASDTCRIDVCVCCWGAISVYSAAVWPASARIRDCIAWNWVFRRLPRCNIVHWCFHSCLSVLNVSVITKTLDDRSDSRFGVSFRCGS